MSKTIIHVNQHNIKFNKQYGNIKPVFTIKNGKTNRYAVKVIIKGPSQVVYSFDKPLSCGGHAWIETNSEVECLGEMSFTEVCQLDNQKI